MATAAKITIVQVSEIVKPGEIDPEAVITPKIFVDRVVQIAAATPLAEAGAAG
jgi:3-oxoadipate CoA-transferase, alpha subunit